MSAQTTLQPGDSDQCAARRPGATTEMGAGRLPCVLDAGHHCPHRDAFGHSFTTPDQDETEHTATWPLARAGRPQGDRPAEVRMLADLDALYTWATERGVRVHLVSTDADGRHIHVAHHQRQSQIAKGPPRERVWYQEGFQT